MISYALIRKIFNAAYMERWNDKIRPMPFIELDKQAHKMIIAYFLGKYEETHPDFDWDEVIEGGIFELLQRIVVTDIKPPIFYRIKSDASKYRELNAYVYRELHDSISCLGKDFCERFKTYFDGIDDTLNKRILSAAHLYSSNWEYESIKSNNPNAFDIEMISRDFETKLERFYDLEGMRRLVLYKDNKKFVDLCGQLRFQTRWSANLHRIPKTSVLGHSLYVAIFSYLFTREMKACARRRYNNYFTGLFHDLPELVTRDIISPVKVAVEGLKDLIQACEKELMEENIYPCIPEPLRPEIHYFTEGEFDSVACVDGKRVAVSSDEINTKYNEDTFNARDGRIVRAVDHLAAYIEASEAVENGCDNEEFERAKNTIRAKYEKSDPIGGLNFSAIYANMS